MQAASRGVLLTPQAEALSQCRGRVEDQLSGGETMIGGGRQRQEG